jgi:three-Cys-motif partner protein
MLSSTPIVGPWAKEKLEALSRYLDFYTKVLKNQRWCKTIYVDAFAGGGRAIVRAAPSQNSPDQLLLLDENEADADQVELISGSPRVALEVASPFSWYVFIDPHPDRASELRVLRQEYTDHAIDVLQVNAESGIEWVVSHGVSRRTHRGIAFLDPFGAKLKWDIIKRLADTGLFEVVVNFTLNMAIQRMLPNNGNVSDACSKTLDEYFGDHDWFSAVYEVSERNLLGERNIKKYEDYLVRLLDLYRSRLRQAFGHVSTPRLIRNTRGAPLYYLLWAGPHQKGLEGADYILKMGERLRRSGA